MLENRCLRSFSSRVGLDSLGLTLYCFGNLLNRDMSGKVLSFDIYSSNFSQNPFSTNHFLGNSILSVSQFDKEDINYLFSLTEQMRDLVKTRGTSDLLKDKVEACIFFEPSTRTSSSFIAAMERLGGKVIPITQGVQFSSVSKGESFEDTMKTLSCYSDCLVIRHPEVGAAARAASACDIPVINAGDGVGEHPTQALLDLFTIQDNLGKLDSLHIGMVGDLLNGRTIHSLIKLLSMYDVKISLVSPPQLRLPQEFKKDVVMNGNLGIETERLEDVISDVDVLYVTRVQKERFADEAEYNTLKASYVITPELMADAAENMILMHPLPRVGEIAESVDSDPRAAYFRQVENGMYVRMALLAAVLGRG